jgi:hypothetical protein
MRGACVILSRFLIGIAAPCDITSEAFLDFKELLKIHFNSEGRKGREVLIIT